MMPLPEYRRRHCYFEILWHVQIFFGRASNLLNTSANYVLMRNRKNGGEMNGRLQL